MDQRKLDSIFRGIVFISYIRDLWLVREQSNVNSCEFQAPQHCWKLSPGADVLPGLSSEDAETTENPGHSKAALSLNLLLTSTFQKKCLQPGDSLSGMILQGYSPAERAGSQERPERAACGRLDSRQTFVAQQPVCPGPRPRWAQYTVAMDCLV